MGATKNTKQESGLKPTFSFPRYGAEVTLGQACPG